MLISITGISSMQRADFDHRKSFLLTFLLNFFSLLELLCKFRNKISVSLQLSQSSFEIKYFRTGQVKYVREVFKKLKRCRLSEKTTSFESF